MGSMISLLHPSRQRPGKSLETVKKWVSRASAGVPIEIIVSLDTDDHYRHQYLKQYDVFKKAKVIFNDNRSAVDAINNAAKVASGDILIVLSDDTDCPNRWDQVILSAVDGRKDYILKVYDGAQQWIVTMPIIDRMYYNRFGYVYYPEFKHMFVDTHFTHVGDALKRIIWRNDITFEHLHYSVGKATKDDLNLRCDNTWDQGKHLYISLLKQNFNLPHNVNIWNLSEYATTHQAFLEKMNLWGRR